MKKNIFNVLCLMIISAIFLGACSPSADPFADLPVPVASSYQASYNVLKMGDTTKGVFSSYFMGNDFNETHSGPGGMESDMFRISVAGENYYIARNGISYGDILGGEVTVNSGYRVQKWNPEDPNLTPEQRQEVIRQMSVPSVGYVTLKYTDGKILAKLLSGCTKCSSRLTLVYVSPEPGMTPVLAEIQYSEATSGPTGTAFDMTGSAFWANPLSDFGSPFLDINGDGVGEIDLRNWGFWQTQSSTQLVKTAMEYVRDQVSLKTPTLKNEDLDSGKELIGRQTGLHIFRDGSEIGQYNFIYKNNYGHMPNTPYIGSGSLSRIERKLNEECYAISVINPSFATSFSTLYVFEDCALADQVEATPYGVLYDMISQGSAPTGIYFGVYSNGYVGTVTDTVSVSAVMKGFLSGNISAGNTFDMLNGAKNGATSTETVVIGEGGGVYYAILGYPTIDQLRHARGVISGMGRGTMDAVGFGFASGAMSGNGMEYYLGAVILSKCAGQDRLGEYLCDSGLLDRSGYLTLP